MAFRTFDGETKKYIDIRDTEGAFRFSHVASR